MHTKDARAIGETEQRIYGLAAWAETPYFTARERAALAFTEAVTLLADTHVPDQAYQDVAAEFSPQEIAALVSLIVTINAWNAIGVSTRAWMPGSSSRALTGRAGQLVSGAGCGSQAGAVAVGQVGPAARPAQRRPRVSVAEIGRGLRVQAGQHATADIARRLEAEAETLRDVVAVQQRLMAAQRGEAFRIGRAGRVKGPHVRG